MSALQKRFKAFQIHEPAPGIEPVGVWPSAMKARPLSREPFHTLLFPYHTWSRTLLGGWYLRLKLIYMRFSSTHLQTISCRSITNQCGSKQPIWVLKGGSTFESGYLTSTSWSGFGLFWRECVLGSELDQTVEVRQSYQLSVQTQRGATGNTCYTSRAWPWDNSDISIV